MTTQPKSLQTTSQNAKQGYFSEDQLQSLETWLDSKFAIPGTNFRIGLDGIIGLIPGVGDVATSGMSAIFIADTIKSGGRKRIVVKMIGNVLIDMLVGTIPLVGDIFDFAFRSNTKNLALLRRERELLSKLSNDK